MTALAPIEAASPAPVITDHALRRFRERAQRFGDDLSVLHAELLRVAAPAVARGERSVTHGDVVLVLCGVHVVTVLERGMQVKANARKSRRRS